MFEITVFLISIIAIILLAIIFSYFADKEYKIQKAEQARLDRMREELLQKQAAEKQSRIQKNFTDELEYCKYLQSLARLTDQQINTIQNLRTWHNDPYLKDFQNAAKFAQEKPANGNGSGNGNGNGNQ